MHSMVRQYQFILKHEEFIQHITDEYLPELKQIPGFVSFSLIDVGDEGGRMVSVEFFDNAAGVAEAKQHAADWVRKNMGVFQMATVVEEGPVVVAS